MSLFIRAANPIWWIPDLTGVSLNDEYFAFFKQNTFPYLPQAVYTTPNGTPWPDPLRFLPSGTLPNNLYFDPALTYRIEIRHGNTQADALIWLVENFVPGQGSEIENDMLVTAENMITNPQFADINLGDTKVGASYVDNAIIITEAGTYNIAPGWDLVIVGTGGTTTITQGVNSGASNITGNPAYYLEFNNSGWTSVDLIQRFSNNGAIFSGGAIALSLTARATGSAQQLTVSYEPSVGVATDLLNTVVSVGSFENYANAVTYPTDFPLSTNSDTGEDAYVDIDFSLPPTGIIALSNIQLIGQSEPLSSNFVNPNDVPLYAEQTYERMVDHEFHVYRDSLVRQPKQNLLAGWDFGLNPWQFRDTASSNVATNEYTADQTIIIQQNYVQNNVGNNVAVGRGTAANNYSFDVTAVTAANQFAILQLIAPETMRPYWGSNVSILAKAKITTSHSSKVRLKSKIIYWNNGLDYPGNLSRTNPISSWNATTNAMTLFSNWNLLPHAMDPEYILEGDQIIMKFDLFNLPPATTEFMTLGVMLYTLDPMDQTATADVIHFEKVTLVQNDFAVDCSETWDESLRKCQFYYQKTFDVGVVPENASGTLIGALSYFVSTTGVGAAGAVWSYPSIIRETSDVARGTPLITAYNPINTGAGNDGHWYNIDDGATSGTATFSQISQQSALISNTQIAGDNAREIVSVHLTADSRLALNNP